tara:strand:+ start:810 stop:1130 length:321 start_codon:yes stop_codon:yes gene_type:complete
MTNTNEIAQDYKVERTLQGERYDNEMLNLHWAIKQIYCGYYNEIGFKRHHMIECIERANKLMECELKTNPHKQIVMGLRNILKTMKLIVKVNAMEMKLEDEMKKMK